MANIYKVKISDAAIFSGKFVEVTWASGRRTVMTKAAFDSLEPSALLGATSRPVEKKDVTEISRRGKKVR